jgi:hypothetical protein
VNLTSARKEYGFTPTNEGAMAERPWWRELDGRPPWPNPKWWDRSPVARAGFIFSVFCGGSLVLRLIFPDWLGGGAWLYAALTAVSLAVLALGVVQARRHL